MASFLSLNPSQETLMLKDRKKNLQKNKEKHTTIKYERGKVEETLGEEIQNSERDSPFLWMGKMNRK